MIDKIKNGALERALFKCLPIKNTILFESVPNLANNTRAVFDEMVARGLNKKYELIWILNHEQDNLPQIENVTYLLYNDRRLTYYKCTSKCVICCNDFLVTIRKGQQSYYLTHGTPLKSCNAYYTIPNKIDYCICASKDLVPIYSYEYNFDEKKIVPLGLPENDNLTNIRRDLHPLFPNHNYDKIIVWYPTYRQHKNGNTLTSTALPIIGDIQNAVKLNEAAQKNNTLIVLKPHFAQDVSYITDLNLSNILFINDQFFADHKISSYEFVGNCDALISDYSSVYLDFMLCDKPIALVWEDIEEYKKNPGLARNIEKYLDGGEQVYTIEELSAFIEHVANNEDILKERRSQLCGMVNYSKDGKNAARVVDFIIEKSNL